MHAHAQRKVEAPAPAFDLVTHRRDKFGKVIEINPYRMFCFGDERYFERPKLSGNLFFGDGSAAGRLGTRTVERANPKTKEMQKVIENFCEMGAAHIAFVAPPTSDQKLAQEMADAQITNAALKAELEALKQEAAAWKAAQTAPQAKGEKVTK